MSNREKIDEYYGIEFLYADGFDAAIIGVEFYTGHQKVVYSIEKCIEILKFQDMTEEEAYDYFEFNVAGSYVGEQTPLWIETI
tara:strand:- start:381 stop:629 length:249 start_codon:yes stop_codon:yes gene_type:complete